MKKILSFLLVFTVVFSLCACGGNNNQENTKGTVSQQEAKKENNDEAKKETNLTPISLGDKITLDFAEMTIDECGIKEDIKTSITTGNTTYTTGPEVVSGSKYVYMRGIIKNVTKAEISSVSIDGKVEIDGYTYDIASINIIEENGSLAYPLMTYKYTLYAKIPNELADSNKSCVLNIGFDENFENSSKELSEYKYGYTLNIQ